MFQRSWRISLLFRIPEFIGCATCFGLSLFILDYTDSYLALVTYIPSIVSAAFLLLTFLDLFGLLCTLSPIPWQVWLIACAVAVCALFIASGMLLSAVKLSLLVSFETSLIFGITAFIFLLELLYLFILTVFSKKVKKTIVRKIVPVDYDEQIVQKRKESPVYLEPVEEPPAYLEPVEEPEILPVQAPTPINEKSHTARYYENLDQLTIPSDTETARVRKPTITSYGGTFHVSKEVAPLPSPQLCRSKTCIATSCSSQPITPEKPTNERRLSTAPAETNERSSSFHQQVEQVEVYEVPQRIFEAETERGGPSEERVAVVRDYEGTSQGTQMVAPDAARGSNGVMTYRCLRCGCIHTYNYVQPSSTYYQRIPPGDTPTRRCCPCPEAVREGVLTTSPVRHRAAVQTTESATSDSVSDMILAFESTRSPPGSASVQQSLSDTRIRYSTTFQSDDDTVNRRGHKRKQQKSSQAMSCTIL